MIPFDDREVAAEALAHRRDAKDATITRDLPDPFPEDA